jgi:hypothetical protein
MPTILQILGWRLFFYANESQEPMHIHCTKAGMDCKWKQRDKNQPKSTVKNQPSLMTGTPVRVRLKPDSKGRVFRLG